MAEKRRLPVLQSAPSRASGGDSREGEARDDAPAWHWIPLGMLSTILVGAVLARVLWVPYASGVVQSLGLHPSAVAMASAQSRLALVGALVATLSTVIGGFTVGLLGSEKVNQRHGLLAGAGAMVLVGLLSGARMGAGGAIAAALMIPIGAMAGYVGAVGGLVARAKIPRGE
ncbi:MAG: hypothetical protein U0269_18955 [Polyangiales bacterium]